MLPLLKHDFKWFVSNLFRKREKYEYVWKILNEEIVMFTLIDKQPLFHFQFFFFSLPIFTSVVAAVLFADTILFYC